MQNIFVPAINIVMDSIILDQLNNLGKDSEVNVVKTKICFKSFVT